MKKYLAILAVGLGSILFSQGLEHSVALLAIGIVFLLVGICLICSGETTKIQ